MAGLLRVLNPGTNDAALSKEKPGPQGARPHKLTLRKRSGDDFKPLLLGRLGVILWRRRKLQNRSHLAFDEVIEHDDGAVWQFQCIVVPVRDVRVDLAEASDLVLVGRLHNAPEAGERLGLDVVGERDFRSRHDTHCNGLILASAEALAGRIWEACRDEFVTYRRWAG